MGENGGAQAITGLRYVSQSHLSQQWDDRARKVHGAPYGVGGSVA